MARLPRAPFAGSLSLHLALLVALLALRGAREVPRATDTAARTDAKLVFLSGAGAAHGGGGSGAKGVDAMRRIEARGVDASTVPVAPPPPTEVLPVAPVLELEAPVVSAVPAFADIDTAQGSIDPRLPRIGSLGPGSGDAAGAHPGDGNGPGDGPGLGPGRNGGTGGDVYSPGNGVTAPIAVLRVRPQYTSAAMKARLAGSVLVECVVMPDGSVGSARVTRSLDPRWGLDDEALKAARGWRFRPGTREGHPVAVRVTIELSFSVY